MSYYGRIEVSERIDVNKASGSKECITVTIGICFKIKNLRFNHQSVMDGMIHYWCLWTLTVFLF